MRVPNGDRADLGTKLEDYILNMAHHEGRHKARMFASVLGLTSGNSGSLRQALLETAATSDEAESRGDSKYGTLYSIPFSLSTAEGSATVLSVWIIRDGEDFPRLTTCYIV